MILESSKERILQYIDFKSIKIKDFYSQTNIKRGLLDGDKIKATISDVFIAKILESFPDLNPIWLITGKGEMLLSEEKNEKPSEVVMVSHKNEIPIYDVVITAGTGYVSVENQTVEYINPGDFFRGADAVVRIYGDSMDAKNSLGYVSGDLIPIRHLHNKSSITPGEDYVIHTNDFRTFKRLQKSALPGHHLACSINQETWENGELAGRLIHEPFDINLDDTISISVAMGIIRFKQPSYINGRK